MHFFFNLLGVSRLKSKFHHQTTYPSARTLWSQTQIDKFYFQTVSDPKVRFLKKVWFPPNRQGLWKQRDPGCSIERRQ